ncbi:RNA-binding protein [Candidatus Roizmanbacteria bacterium CG02_land_8_20_14_3_00_36_15]|uniref:RNA-binding protein n=2 Tax=Candidatus Roizmaniibacteriota TaxID=1752723 RepID=A0A2M8KLL8_9BACT|nr:MAG: RNA-binding protein [Candidatus Roizmanbacteria bacterium CG03_land_8_20_14_0_80_36_21]PIV37675.1 MAG: RNA-binding protein [Candidatus Roizmanbacteria bacterium CG02_land_8_20_14_3_00_36_15]PIY69632.1 MAG: RNA-binding protein [Candidatus Roizmanbacteria bacterium CG_4_10_14_0_8_um_filter_36_36]PJA53236.1 MAG: RNA-binding protein [Candidatus Roizmanbacteria bacterium CG_4_9_14_3_um_filter_36_11]PJC82142.1 MAG: RNA-binding protein [Candidatus Roizmanbacteria bacterium CG_4_8_14_3_um_filte
MDKKKLYVGNLPWSVTDQSLRDMFSAIGEVTEAVVITDKYTGRSKGFGFVTFANEADAEKAVAELADKEVDGRKIVVNVARPREERPDRGGSGGFRKDFNRRRF